MKTHGATIQMKPLQQFFRTLPFNFLYFTKRNLVCFSRLANGRNAGVIHNYCENNKFKENFSFVKTQNSKKSASITVVLSRFPSLNFVDRFFSGKGQGYFAERRMHNGIVLRRLQSGLLVQNIGRIVTDVTKVSNLAQSFLSTYRLILEGVPVTNGPNYK